MYDGSSEIKTGIQWSWLFFRLLGTDIKQLLMGKIAGNDIDVRTFIAVEGMWFVDLNIDKTWTIVACILLYVVMTLSWYI